MNLRKAILPVAAAILILGVWGVAQAEHPPIRSTPTFDRFKSLVGTWRGTATHTDGKIQETTVIYTLSSGGSALIETLFAGSDHEMMTVYYLDGDTVALTHYCMLDNQPHMVAQPSGDPNTVRFVFDSGTNIPNPAAPHMHEVVFTFSGDDHILTRWTMYQDGKPADSVDLDLHRSKNSP